eukprot:RCo020392
MLLSSLMRKYFTCIVIGVLTHFMFHSKEPHQGFLISRSDCTVPVLPFVPSVFVDACVNADYCVPAAQLWSYLDVWQAQCPPSALVVVKGSKAFSHPYFSCFREKKEGKL